MSVESDRVSSDSEVPASGARYTGYVNVNNDGVRGLVSVHIGASKEWTEAIGKVRSVAPAGSPIYACEAWSSRVRSVVAKAAPRVSRAAGGAWGRHGFVVELWATSGGGSIARITPKDHETKDDSAVIQIPVSLARATACGRCRGCTKKA